MFVQHARGQGALRGPEVRQRLRRGRRGVRLRGAGGKIKSVYLFSFITVDDATVKEIIKKYIFGINKGGQHFVNTNPLGEMSAKCQKYRFSTLMVSLNNLLSTKRYITLSL